MRAESLLDSKVKKFELITLQPEEPAADPVTKVIPMSDVNFDYWTVNCQDEYFGSTYDHEDKSYFKREIGLPVGPV